jgi:hypothetical protein
MNFMIVYSYKNYKEFFIIQEIKNDNSLNGFFLFKTKIEFIFIFLTEKYRIKII